MVFTINNKFYQFCLITCLLVLVLIDSYEVTFVIWSITALLTLRKKYSVQFTSYIAILTSILLLALFSSLYNDYLAYNFLRDIAYLLKPILGMFVGYNICKILGKKAANTIINIAAITAIIHVLIIAYSFIFFGIKSLNNLRSIGGYFNDYEVYVLILLLFRDKFQIEISDKKAKIFIGLIALSTTLYFARTNIIQVLILSLAMLGYFKLTLKSVKVLSIIMVVTLVSYAAIFYSNPQRQGKGIEAFLYKVKIAPFEAFKTKINQDDWRDFHDNYRSFENIKTVKQLKESGSFTILFGKGLGSNVDIGRKIWTNDGEMIRYLPTLHNAYMTIFLKAGLIGVFLSILFIYLLFNQRNSEDVVVKNCNYLLIGTAIFLIFSNWVFMGLYLKLDNKSIFLGFLLCYREIFLKENSFMNRNKTKAEIL